MAGRLRSKRSIWYRDLLFFFLILLLFFPLNPSKPTAPRKWTFPISRVEHTYGALASMCMAVIALINQFTSISYNVIQEFTLLRNKRQWINRFAILANFEIQNRRLPRTLPHVRDDFTGRYLLAVVNEHFSIVAVRGQ